MEILNEQNVKMIFQNMADAMMENKDFLTQLDAEAGDGDLGLTMSSGFKKVAEKLSAISEADVGKLIMVGGSTLAQVVPSTMGTLLGSGLMKGGKTLQGKTEVTLADVAKLFSAIVEGIAARGKSKPGEKTVLDSLHPAAETLKVAVLEKKTLASGLNEAYTAAIKGLEDTKNMVPQHGRAVYHQETALGRQDPGATVGMLIVKSFAEIF